MGILDIYAIEKKYLEIRSPEHLVEDALRAASVELNRSSAESAALLSGLTFDMVVVMQPSGHKQNAVVVRTCNGNAVEELFKFNVDHDKKRITFVSPGRTIDTEGTAQAVMDTVGHLLSSDRVVLILAREALHRRRSRSNL